MNYWLRLYTNTLDNRKAQRLPGEDFKGWVNILCLAKEHDGLLPSIEDIAFRLRITEADAERLVEELVKRELLDRTEDGITPHDWEEWQCLSDDDPTAAIRARRYRQKTRDVTDTVTRDDTDASQTSHAAREEKSRDRAETEKSREEAARAKPRSPKRPTTCDSEFLAELQASPAYTVFDVAAIYYRMVEWCRIRGKQPTRARLVNWLNREDRPMTANGKPPKIAAAYVGKNKPTVEEPMAEEMDEYVDTAILANDLVYLAKLRDEILKRGAVHDWERKVLAYFEQPISGNEPVTPAEMADLNKRIAALQPITRVG